MFCSKCGTKLPDGVKFCPNCGSPVGAAPVAPPPSAAMPGVPVAAPGVPVVPAPRARRRGPIVIAAVAVVAVVVVVAVAATRLLGGPAKEAAGANGMGNSVTNIAIGAGQAVSAGGVDYFFDDNGLECAKANDSGSVKQLCSFSDSTYVGMLNYADGRLFYVSYDNNAGGYKVKSVKVDGSDEETLYSLDSDYNYFPWMYITGGRIYVVYGAYQSRTESLHIVSMATDGSAVRSETDLTMSCGSGHYVAISGDRVYYSDDLADDGTGGGSSVYSMNYDGSDTKKIFTSNGGSVESITIVGDRVLIAAHDHWGGHGSGSTDSHYVASMNADGSDAKKITDASNSEIDIIGANNDTVYLSENNSYSSVPAEGGDRTDIGLPDSFQYGYLFGADDHVVANNSALLNYHAYNVGSMKPDGSNYVEYFKREN